MRNSLKAAVVLLSIILVLIVVNYSSVLNYTANKESAEQTARIEGEQLGNYFFIPETYGYEDKIVFTFVLRDPKYAADYYATYEIKEDGNTIESANSKLYENVTFENAIFIEIPRKSSSVYELEIMINDEEGNKVHQSGITLRS
ncbi:hypothetical protein MCMEM_1469 [Methanococcoides methylutens MM1]|uniref:Uncharacterized protein n=1 Tax=Methanococcoides methylutens MM1 TaxID=1434104 RepID=A0A0E3SSR5_METMT|nr:hypothetical protein MCMEM_1469 [Methanococcoides methylutens MM1]